MAFTPTAAEFDDLELALGGALPEISLEIPAGSQSTTTGRGADAGSAGAPDPVELTDDEGTPIALFHPLPADDSSVRDPLRASAVARVRGTVEPLRPHESGRFGALRRPAREVAAHISPTAVGIATSSPLTAPEVAAVRALSESGTPVLVLALVGTGRPAPLRADALLRTLTEAAGRAESAAGIAVVAVPLRARPDLDSAADDALVRAVARAYGVVDLRRPGELQRPDRPDHPDPSDQRGDPGSPDHRPDPGRVPPNLPDLPVLRRELARARPGNGGRGAVVLFTGLSGSGKSTVARGVADALAEDGERSVTLLDGDVVRRNLSAGLGFSRADRNRNVARIGFVAALVAEHGGIALAAPIAPYAATRAEVRAAAEAVGDFVLVHVATPLAVCEARDRKGLYARARRGEILEFTGISDPYEVPDDADLVLDTATVPVNAGVVAVLDRLRALGHLSAAGSVRALG